MELGVIVLSVPPESSVQDVGALAEGSCEPEEETSQAIVEKMAQGAQGIDNEVEGLVKTLVTLPHYDLCSSVSSGSRDEAQLKVHLAQLHLEAQEKAQDRQAQLEFRLQVKRLEIEAHKAVRLCQLELESQKGTPRAEVAKSDPP